MTFTPNIRRSLLLALLIPGLALGIYGAYGAVHRHTLVSAHYAPPPQGMVLVPAGAFLLGSPEPDAPADVGALRSAFLPAFYIDIYEVTHTDYKTVNPAYTIPEGKADFPVTGLSLEEARAYAAAIGKRLPTAAEWEKAARGTDGRVFPWGDTFQEGFANLVGKESLVPVGSFPKGVSPYGAHDMIGNAWEWVETPYIQKSLLGKPLFTTEIIKGGAFSYPAFQGEACYNGFEGNGGTCHDVGFRCVQDASPR